MESGLLARFLFNIPDIRKGLCKHSLMGIRVTERIHYLHCLSQD